MCCKLLENIGNHTSAIKSNVHLLKFGNARHYTLQTDMQAAFDDVVQYLERGPFKHT